MLPDDRRRKTLSSLSRILEEQLDQGTTDQHADPEARVKRALQQRPRFTIKARLTLLFSVFFLITAVVSAMAWFQLSEIEHSAGLVAVTEAFAHEVQEVRRYEKNFFLYDSDLTNVETHLNEANRLLETASNDIGPLVGGERLARLRRSFQSYHDLLNRLMQQTGDEELDKAREELHALEGSLREHGAQMLLHAFSITQAERRAISAALSWAKRTWLILFLLLLPIYIYVGVHIYQHIIARLTRLMLATQQFAGGNFSPILPVRKYKDEFSTLAIALNHMMYELEKRQEILVESHKMRAVGNLTAGVAHELNNPLNNIILTSEMLKEDWYQLGDENRLEMVDELTEQADRARRVVKNLLDFARESEAKIEHLDINQLLEEVLNLAANQVRINKIKLHVHAGPHLPPVLGDRNLLVQVFLNLILNAIDAMPSGGHLSIRVTKEEETGFLGIHIQDTGVGIPPHLQKSIFDPFFTTKPTGKGTGLGLAVSQGIVNHHGGDIEVMSNIGAGTTFSVHLPSLPVPAELTKNPD